MSVGKGQVKLTGPSASLGWDTSRLGQPARRCPPPWSPVPVAWQQTAVMAAILLGTALLSQFGLGAFSRVFFIAAGLAAAWVYISRSPWQFVTLTFWFWTLTPLARRLIDYGAGFDPVNYVLGTPNLLALFMLKSILTSVDLRRCRETVAGLFVLMPILYGLLVNFVQGEVVAGIAGAADWIAPLLYYFYFLANWRTIGDAEREFRAFLTLNGLIMVGYGIYQYFAPTAWDVYWVLQSGLTSIGRPVPYELRVFGTLNLSGTLAIWVGALLLLWIEFRTKVTIFLVPAAILLLLMTLVRSVLGTVVFGLLLASVMGRAGIMRVLSIGLLAIVLVGAAVSVGNPEMTDRLMARLDTLNNLNADDSAIQRQILYRAAPALIDNNPLGIGIGGIGRGAAASQNDEMVSIDSGPIAIYLTLGWIGGSVYLAGIVLVLAQASIAARSTRSPAAFALAIAATASAANLLFANMTGLYAATVWTCAAYAASLGIADREGQGAITVRRGRTMRQVDSQAASTSALRRS